MPRTAITINFPELGETVDIWRTRTIKEARAGVPPQITLLFPWKLAPVSDADIASVVSLCSDTQAFEVEFDELKYFASGTVYFSVTNDQYIQKLSNKIWSAFPDTPPYGGQYQKPTPHLTVAQGNAKNIAALYAEVKADLSNHLPYICNVEQVSVLEENKQGMWQIRTNIALN